MLKQLNEKHLLVDRMVKKLNQTLTAYNQRTNRKLLAKSIKTPDYGIGIGIQVLKHDDDDDTDLELYTITNVGVLYNQHATTFINNNQKLDGVVSQYFNKMVLTFRE